MLGHGRCLRHRLRLGVIEVFWFFFSKKNCFLVYEIAEFLWPGGGGGAFGVALYRNADRCGGGRTVV
jgi:hypothetical protein